MQKKVSLGWGGGGFNVVGFDGFFLFCFSLNLAINMINKAEKVNIQTSI